MREDVRHQDHLLAVQLAVQLAAHLLIDEKCSTASPDCIKGLTAGRAIWDRTAQDESLTTLTSSDLVNPSTTLLEDTNTLFLFTFSF